MDLETDIVKQLQVFRDRCLESEEKSQKYELRCLMLEDEVENLKKQNKELEGKIKSIQSIVRSEDEEDKFIELMIENKVLECEKTKAETEVCSLKDKVKELTSRMCELESNIKCTNEKVHVDINDIMKGTKEEYCSRVRKRLMFENISPSTPGIRGQPFSGFIDVSDEDSSDDSVRKVNKCFDTKKQVSSSTKRKRATNIVTSDDEKSIKDDKEDMGRSKVHSLNTKRAKRKRAVKIISSDDDISCDDSAPISTLVKKRHSSRYMKDSDDKVKKNGSKRYLTRLRKLESENTQDINVVDMNKTVSLYGNSSSDDMEDDDDGSQSESESPSLDGFIVDDCESVSDVGSKSGGSCDESESEDDYKGTLDKIGRKKVSNMKWDLEGDMLSDFGKDPELCMRAVCALYRQQTEDEKASKVTIHNNNRGFSQPDAYRATKLAEFLTEGHSGDDLNKTVEELKQFDSKGIKLCKKLATKYSKQLFEIYQNKEDEYFMPPC